MCGIIGIISQYDKDVINKVLEGLLSLQHRGQDSSGISNGKLCIKDYGYAINIFNNNILEKLKSNIAIGHVRYSTTKVKDTKQIQPFVIDVDYKISLVHNGNIINIDYMKQYLSKRFGIISDSNSDSEILTQIIYAKLYFEFTSIINKDTIFEIVEFLQKNLIGSFSVILIIEDVAVVCFRDRYGIRPLLYGTNKSKGSHLFSSESGIYESVNFNFVRDILPGETMYISNITYDVYTNVNPKSYLIPCIFEYLYFARQDSYINEISVYQSRLLIGELLGKTILERMNNEKFEIDCIVPVPDTSRIFALGVHNILKVPYHEALVKNRYIDRTFILENENEINKNIKRKLNTVDHLIKDKCVMVVDDSIVRGNTSKYVVSLLKKAGAKKIYIASASPPVCYPNNFGIFIESCNECIAFNRSLKEIEKILGIDKIIYNNLENIINVLKSLNNKVIDFEVSMFNNELCYNNYL